MLEHILRTKEQPSNKQASIKDGLIERKPLGACNDRPLAQMDSRQQWSDYSVIPGYENGIPGNPGTI